MTDSIETLLNKPSEQWTSEELKAAFAAALYKLNQANALINSYESLIEQQTAAIGALNDNGRLFKTTIDTYQLALQMQAESRPKKKVGRPAKHANLLWLYQWWLSAREKHGNLRDRPLIERAIKAELKASGKGEYRFNDIEPKKLETFRKLLVEARYQAKRLSRN